MIDFHVDFSGNGIQAFLDSRATYEISVFTGTNNSGKSFILKEIYNLLGKRSEEECFPIRCQRFFYLNQLSGGLDTNQVFSQVYQNFSNERQQSMNLDQSLIDLNTAILDLTDSERTSLWKLAGNLLGNNTQITMEATMPDNQFCAYKILINGDDLMLASTGTRLLLYILSILLNSKIKNITIDEPELGLTPQIQIALAKTLYDSNARKQYFAHIKKLFIATHSHLFLDFQCTNNNFVVNRSSSGITIHPVDSDSSLSNLQFRLLGNSFTTLFLPSAFILMEGKTDQQFFNRLLKYRFPDANLVCIGCGSDGEIPKAIHSLQRFFLDFKNSPYHDRIFIIIDQVHSLTIKDLAKKKNIPIENIHVWTYNGIENYYPDRVLKKVLKLDSNTPIEKPLDIKGSVVFIEKKELEKDALNRLVIEELGADETYSSEVEEVLKQISEKL